LEKAAFGGGKLDESDEHRSPELIQLRKSLDARVFDAFKLSDSDIALLQDSVAH
jgi:hypothetical protein